MPRESGQQRTHGTCGRTAMAAVRMAAHHPERPIQHDAVQWHRSPAGQFARRVAEAAGQCHASRAAARVLRRSFAAMAAIYVPTVRGPYVNRLAVGTPRWQSVAAVGRPRVGGDCTLLRRLATALVLSCARIWALDQCRQDVHDVPYGRVDRRGGTPWTAYSLQRERGRTPW